MKRYITRLSEPSTYGPLIVLSLLLAAGYRIAADLVPSALTFTVASVGTPSTSDRDAFRFVIDRDNASRTNAGLAAWPTASAKDYRTSYELFCSAMIQGLHTNYIVQASQVERVLEKIPKETQLEINRAVLDLLNSGATPDAIIQRLK
jgi:hypothetical protein